MDLRVLKYFLAVAQEESISRAAEFVHVTQPTLSRQIMELEKELGVKLFHRGKKNRRITLSDEGLLLRERARELVSLADKTRAEFSKSDKPVNGEVFIGGGETDGMRLIARSVRALRKKYPLISYHLFSGNAQDVTERLDKGLLDFGLLIGASKLDKYDFITLPAADRWGLLMRKDDPLASRPFISSKDLTGVDLLVSRQALLHNEMAGWFGAHKEQLNIVASYNLIYNAALLVEEGVGCALTLDKLVNTQGRRELCFKLLKPQLQSSLYLVWKKHQVFSKAAEVFLQYVRKQIRTA